MSNFLPIGERLKDERERLGLNQTDFAALGGAGRKTQFNYETGERVPDGAYLSAIAAAGADVLYILTGQRVPGYVPEPALNHRQRALLDNYDNSPEAGKKIIEGTASLAAQSVRKTG